MHKQCVCDTERGRERESKRPREREDVCVPVHRVRKRNREGKDELWELKESEDIWRSVSQLMLCLVSLQPPNESIETCGVKNILMNIEKHSHKKHVANTQQRPKQLVLRSAPV